MSLGRQSGSDTVVMGPNLQLTTSGLIIPPEEQQYQWAEPLLAQYSIIPRHTLDAVPVLTNGLHFAVDLAKQLFGKNIISFLLVTSECNKTLIIY